MHNKERYSIFKTSYRTASKKQKALEYGSVAKSTSLSQHLEQYYKVHTFSSSPLTLTESNFKSAPSKTSGEEPVPQYSLISWCFGINNCYCKNNICNV
jgi:hypothetical protein